MKGCGNPECRCSTGIHGGYTFGSGELDQFGYWENPCALCARENEKRHPEDGPCWPFKDKEDADKVLGKGIEKMEDSKLTIFVSVRSPDGSDDIPVCIPIHSTEELKRTVDILVKNEENFENDSYIHISVHKNWD
jgi:hypothetical protein